MVTSITTTSGSNSLASFTARRPSAASPHTFQPGWFSKTIFNPLRINSWSSAIRIFTSFIGPHLGGDDRPHGRSPSTRLDLEPPTQSAYAFAHTGHPHPHLRDSSIAANRHLTGQPVAFVDDLEDDNSGLPHNSN